MDDDGRRWRVTGRKTVFSGGPIHAITVEEVVLPDGQTVPDYYRVAMADFALVFATTPDDRVLLFRQYRHGVGRVCLGFPGGALQAQEPPLAAARRELLEETGYVSERWESLGGFVTNGNQRCNVAHLFVARDCRRVAAPTSPDLEAPDCVLVPIDELRAQLPVDEVGQLSHVALLALATHPSRATR